jgi:hypothetical protein
MDQLVPLEQRERVKIPAPSKYNGKRDPEAIREWLYEINNYSAFFEFTDAKKLVLITYYLEGTAAAWWTQKCLSETIPATWVLFETQLRDEFLPKNHVKLTRTKLHNLRQVTSVASYSAAFRRLLLNLPTIDEATMVHHFINGLKPMTQLHVELHDPQTLNAAELLALKVDDIQFTRQRESGKPNPPRHNHDSKATLNNLSGGPSKNLAKLTDAERTRLRAIGGCFKCRQRGHLAKECTVVFDARINKPQPSRRPLGTNAVDASTATTSENTLRQ